MCLLTFKTRDYSYNDLYFQLLLENLGLVIPNLAPKPQASEVAEGLCPCSRKQGSLQGTLGVPEWPGIWNRTSGRRGKEQTSWGPKPTQFGGCILRKKNYMYRLKCKINI